MITRYLGTCGCCEREIKVRAGVLVHHGYRRPGDGSIEGDCYGARCVPHELSPEVARDYRDVVVWRRENEQKELQRAMTGQVTQLTDQKWNNAARQYELVELTPADGYNWRQALERYKNRLSSRVRNADAEVARMDRLLKDWAPKPLRMVEEKGSSR